MMELDREVAREQHITVLIVIHDLNLPCATATVSSSSRMAADIATAGWKWWINIPLNLFTACAPKSWM